VSKGPSEMPLRTGNLCWSLVSGGKKRGKRGEREGRAGLPNREEAGFGPTVAAYGEKIVGHAKPDRKVREGSSLAGGSKKKEVTTV